MMKYNFDEEIERRNTDSMKWCRYGNDVIPLWVADMDFKSPQAVIDALNERVQHGVYGYGAEPQALRAALVERLAERYGWTVSPEAIVFVPGVVTGFNLACRAFAKPGEGLLVQTPVYPPILNAARNSRLQRIDSPLVEPQSGDKYGFDPSAFERAITPETRLFILCNPHNPVGRVFRRDELLSMAEICIRHNILIVSDEIHCDLLFSGQSHIPIASLDPEISNRTVTLIAPSKTYNIAGLSCSVAIIENPELRKQYKVEGADLIGGVNIFGFTAALAVYRGGDEWLRAVLGYLEDNRDYVYDFIGARLPGVKMVKPEATYLAWLDCAALELPESPYDFFLKNAAVAMNNGAHFGGPGDKFVRLNFGCSRNLLNRALEQMEKALNERA